MFVKNRAYRPESSEVNAEDLLILEERSARRRAARKRHYDKNAVIIREKKRQQMAEKRAAIKAKRRRTDVTHMAEAAAKQERAQAAEAAAELERAEAAASRTLALMLELKELKTQRRLRLESLRQISRVPSPLPPSSEEDESDMDDVVPAAEATDLVTGSLPVHRPKRMRLETPPSGSPPPEESDGSNEKLPSFYDKLWASMKHR
ncbi:hypothetical protein B0H15DRAFT_952815 [Mycena belliarum]|uniref:Uncharacterized protein n=1 Tax=Mycena belliarum TaxID=1033014 RepID=A0AAD6XN94_9AGAR|nr:hypothetical protein B0H15DRAFT_952815 [Mycena belliae]